MVLTQARLISRKKTKKTKKETQKTKQISNKMEWTSHIQESCSQKEKNEIKVRRRCGIWQAIPTYSSFSSCSLREFRGRVVHWVLQRRRKESKKPRASFIIRVVNFMTGWIPDSPPTPFLSLLLLLPSSPFDFFFVASRFPFLFIFVSDCLAFRIGLSFFRLVIRVSFQTVELEIGNKLKQLS